MKPHVVFSKEEWQFFPLEVAILIFVAKAEQGLAIIRFRIGDETYELSYDKSVESVAGPIEYRSEIRRQLKIANDRWQNRRTARHYVNILHLLTLSEASINFILDENDVPRDIWETLQEVSGSPRDALVFANAQAINVTQIRRRSYFNDRSEAYFVVGETVYVYSSNNNQVDAISGDSSHQAAIQRLFGRTL